MAGLLAPPLACSRAPREPLLTYFSGEHGLSVRYPSSWKTEQAEQDGVWYRYFLGPTTGADRKAGVSATLLAGPLGGSIEDYAQTYLAGTNLVSSADASRQGATGRSYLFNAADGTTRYALLLLQEEGRVYGLYAQCPVALAERSWSVLEQMLASVTLERAAAYPAVKDDRYGFTIGIPASWRETRHFAGGGTLLLQFSSPPLGADRNRETVHASLTLTVEPAPGDGSLADFYEASRQKLGSSFQMLGHSAWRGGYADSLRTETPLATSRGKRFYRVGRGRGYTLSFEARDDVFSRVSRWCDMIAATLRIGAEREAP